MASYTGYTALTLSNLLTFATAGGTAGVGESTDLIQGALQMPYYKPAPYVPNQTFVNGFDEYVAGGGSGRGSQIVLRVLGKGSATVVGAEVAGAFDYSHAQTADTLVNIPLNIVIKQSEKVYEAVEIARQSASGARKAEIVANNLTDAFQAEVSKKLQLVENANTASATDPTTKENLKDLVANALGTKLDYTPDTMVVSREVYGILLQLVSDGSYTPIHGFDTVRSGVIGKFLGMNVVIDENLTDGTGDTAKNDFILYNHNFLNVFAIMNNFSVVPAVDFDGSYVRGLMLLGIYAPIVAKGSGAWAYRHIRGTKSSSE